MVHVQKFRRGLRGGTQREKLFMIILPNDVTRGYHCNASDEQV